MKPKPIIFTGDNPRLIREGLKTQTRRIIKPQPMMKNKERLKIGEVCLAPDILPTDDERNGWCLVEKTGHGSFHYMGQIAFSEKYSRYQVGDRLWVREAWMEFERIDTMESTAPGIWKPTGEYLPAGIGYRSDIDQCGQVLIDDGKVAVCRTPKDPWRNPMFMPRRLSRTTIEVKEVRVQRLWDSTDEDALAEGIKRWIPIPDDPELRPIYGLKYEDRRGNPKYSAVDAYHELWDSIHGKGAWDENPFVWAYTFELTKEGA